MADCLKCGHPFEEHVQVWTTGAAGATKNVCPTAFFVEKPATPKAKPGAYYRTDGGKFERIGTRDGRLASFNAEAMAPVVDMSDQWTEVPE